VMPIASITAAAKVMVGVDPVRRETGKE
jgi:hypothetical protein